MLQLTRRLTPLGSPREGRHVMLILRGHRGKVHTLAFSPDGQMLASVAGHGRSIWLWDVTAGDLIRRADHSTARIKALAFTPGERPLLASTDSQGNLGIWDMALGRESVIGQIAPPLNYPLRIVFSPNGAWLALTGLWRSSSWVGGHPHHQPGVTLCEAITANVGNGMQRDLVMPGKALTCCVFSPDSQTIAAGSLSGAVYLWDVRTGHRPDYFLRHGHSVQHLAYMPDGDTLVSASVNGLVKAWDAHTGHCRGTLKGLGRALNGLAC